MKQAFVGPIIKTDDTEQSNRHYEYMLGFSPGKLTSGKKTNLAQLNIETDFSGEIYAHQTWHKGDYCDANQGHRKVEIQVIT